MQEQARSSSSSRNCWQSHRQFLLLFPGCSCCLRPAAAAAVGLDDATVLGRNRLKSTHGTLPHGAACTAWLPPGKDFRVRCKLPLPLLLLHVPHVSFLAVCVCAVFVNFAPFDCIAPFPLSLLQHCPCRFHLTIVASLAAAAFRIYIQMNASATSLPPNLPLPLPRRCALFYACHAPSSADAGKYISMFCFFCCVYCNNIDRNCRLLLLLLLLHVQVSCCLCNSSSSSGLWSVEEGSRGKGAMAIGSCGLVVSKKGRAHSL